MEDRSQVSNGVVRGTVLALGLWTLAWIASLALAKLGPALLWNENPVLSWIAVGVNLLLGIGWIIAHARYLRGVDDLNRKILMDAIAAALGAGLVGGFAYSAANTAGLVGFDSDIAFISVLMGLVYIIAVGIGFARYR